MEQLPRSHAVAVDWLREGRRVVAATLVESFGSAPLGAGAQMLVDGTGSIEGSVTGGCVEAALVQEAHEVLAGGPARLLTFGVSDRDALDVGLMCGGTVKVFVHELTKAHAEVLITVRTAVKRGEPVALAMLLDGEHAGDALAVLGEDVVGSLGGPGLLAEAVARDARGFFEQTGTAVRHYGPGGEILGSELGVFIEVFATPPSMVIFGAIDFSAALAKLASEVGYRVTICDARSAFARSPHHAEHAEVVVDWPDRYLAGRRLTAQDVILVFTHDPKFDEPAIIAGLESGAGYIGALGSRRTHAERHRRLRAAGVDDAEISRVKSPCGLDIGARTPAETAISVLAEVLAERAGRRGGPLAGSDMPIHPQPALVVERRELRRSGPLRASIERAFEL